MKKRFTAGITAIALLSSCSGNNSESYVYTSESVAQIAESSTQTTTVPAATTTAAEYFDHGIFLKNPDLYLYAA